MNALRANERSKLRRLAPQKHRTTGNFLTQLFDEKEKAVLDVFPFAGFAWTYLALLGFAWRDLAAAARDVARVR